MQQILPATPIARPRWGRLLALLTLLLTGSTSAWAQLTGAKTIPGTYATLAAAIADLNTQGVGSGGVTFNVAASYAETFASPTAGRITATGTAASLIIFQKAGAGANPLITAGTGAGAGTGNQDAIIALSGSDYVTFTNIDVAENSGNTTTAAQFEFGYALFRASATDGCQNVTITGAGITLNKTNTATVGIWGANTTATSTTTVTASSAVGANSTIKLNGNTVANAYVGIYLTGNTAAAANADTGNEVGTTAGNTLSNLGGSATFTYGIRAEYQQNVKIENNSITIPTGTTGNVLGVFLGNTSVTGIVGTVLINNNTVSLATAGTALCAGIYQAGTTGITTLTISNNKVQNCTLTGASGAFYGVYDISTAAATITGNSFTNNNLAGTGNLYGLYKPSAGTSVTVSSNTVTGNTKSAVGSLYGIYLSTGIITNLTLNNNTVSNNQLTGSSTSTASRLAAIYYAIPAGTVTSLTATGNTMNNNQVTNTAGALGLLNGLYLNPTGVATITIEALSTNTFTGNKVTAAYAQIIGIISTVYNSSTAYSVGGAVQVNGNTMTNNSIVSTSGANASSIYGVLDGGYVNTSFSFSNNVLNGLSIAGTNSATANAIYGISSSTYTNGGATVSKTFNQNTVGGLAIGAGGAAPTGTVYGIQFYNGAPVSLAQNKVYDLSAAGASGVVYGLDAESSTTVSATNNVVGNLTAPAGTSSPAVTGLYLNTNTTVNATYNTVYLTGTGGTNFGALGIGFNGSGTLVLRNNLVVNNAAATGTGVSAALGRTIAGTAGTVPTALSTTNNNNLLYAGSGYLYAEGVTTGTVVNAKTTLFDYRNFLYLAPGANNSSTTREQRAVSQNVAFASANGSDANFLQPDATTPTPVESGAQPVSGITIDYAGTTRNAGTPDIGAYEGTYTYLDVVAPGIQYTPLPNTAATTNRAFPNVAVADVLPGSGVNGTSGTRPRVYYKLSNDPNAYNDNTSGTPGWKYAEASGSTSPFSFTIDYSLLPAAPVVGTVIQYFVVAQDGAAVPNVAIDAGTFAAQPASVALTSAAFPIGSTLNQYTITAPLPTAIPVGTGQTYTSLTNTGGLFDAVNNGLLAGNTTVTITSDLAGETGTVALGPLPDNGNNYTLTIQSDGTLRNVTGTATNAAGLIRLAGASRVTFTGAQPAGSRNLLVGNSTASAPTFNFTADASNDALTSLVVESSNTSTTSGAIVLGSGTSTGNSNHTFTSLDVRGTANATTGIYAYGIYSLGASQAVPNANIVVSKSLIHNFTGAGILLSATTANASTNWTIGGPTAADGNQVYQEAARAGYSGIQIGAGTGHLIGNNSVYQTAGTNTGSVYGIILTTPASGGNTVSSNIIGGSAADGSGNPLALSAGQFSGIQLQGTLSTAANSVQDNVVRNVANTGTSSTFGIIVVSGSANIGTVTGNTVGGDPAVAGTAISSVVGLNGINTQSGAGAIRLVNNTVRNLTQTGTTANTSLSGINSLAAGTTVVVTGNTISDLRPPVGTITTTTTGISVGGNGTAATVTNNVVADIVNGASVSGTASVSTTGIAVAATGVQNVTGNVISNVGVNAGTATQSSSTSYIYLVSGLTISNPAAGSLVTRNRVWNVYGASVAPGTGGGADQVRALVVTGSGNATFANNRLSLPATPNASAALYGVIDLSSGTGNYYYNSVYVAPQADATGSSYGFLRNTGTSTLQLRNNIFYNERGTAGSAYALATTSTTNFVGSPASPATNTSDYNLFFVSDAAKMGFYNGTAYSFAGVPLGSTPNWKSVTGGDASSMSETSATVPAASLFTNPSTGDLSLVAGSSAAWYANGTGVQVPAIGTDYTGAARPTTVAAGAPDIGSTQVTPGSTPPALTATPAAPSLGTTQVFTLGGRTLARLAWGSTLAPRPAATAGRVQAALPSNVVGRYYSGTNPPAPFVAGARYANAYFDFQDAGADGSGYTYQPTLTYDPALLGTIPTEADQRLSQRNADNSGYRTYATTVNPAPARTLVGPDQFTFLNVLAISDQAAPLPVQLVKFEAVRQGSDAALSWTTASELDNQGFEVQVSADGQQFRSLGFVAGAGSSSSARTYSFLDKEAGKAGGRYYRLRQVDYSGKSTYSPVRSLTFEVAGLLVQAAPNPFSGNLTLSLTLPVATPAGTLELTDNLGRMVLRQELAALPAGTSEVPVPGVAALPTGLYLLRVALPTGTQVLKVAKE